MAINFRSVVTDPKIEIVGDEVPVAAFEKASNILNQRYAQSAEAATRAQEALNQQLQVSDEKEKEALKAYYNDTYGQLKNIATSDDYLDQEWKTKSLGLRTAANLKVAEERAKIAAQQREQLRLAKNINDPEIRKMYEEQYNEQFKQTKYDPNTGLISFGALNAPRVVEDKSVPQELNKALAGFAANTIGTSWDNVKIVNKGEMIPGTNKPAPATLAYDIKGEKIIENVKEEDLTQAAKDFVASDPGIQSYLDRQVNFLKYKDPNLTDQQALQIVKSTIVDPAIAFTTNKYGYNKDVRKTNQDLNPGLTNTFNTGNGAINPFTNLPWQSTFNGINTEELVKPDMDKKVEIASVAFNKDGSFKEVPSTFLENYAKITGWIAGDINDLPDNKNFNTLVPDWQIAKIKSNNPKFTDKQVYETFMDDVINSKKQLSATYVLANPGLRTALNSNTKALIQTMPIYKLDGGDLVEVTDDERALALKEQVGFVPGTGQVKLGNNYVTGLGVLKPGEQNQDLNPTQTMMAMTSEMINAALNPVVSNATTANRTFNIAGANGQQIPIRLRILKSGVGKPIIDARTGKRKLYPTTIQAVDQNSGKAIGDFVVENNQGIAEFTNFMLNNAAAPYILE